MLRLLIVGGVLALVVWLLIDPLRRRRWAAGHAADSVTPDLPDLGGASDGGDGAADAADD